MILRFFTRHILPCCLAFSCVIAVSYQSAYAIGLGELKHQTYLGQKLDASITVLGAQELAPENIRIRRISVAEARERGIDLLFSSYSFKIEPVIESGVVKSFELKSNENIFEPYVDVLVELTWPGGSVLREYALLFDAPPPSSAVEDEIEPQAAQTQDAGPPSVAQIELGSRYQVRPGDTLSGILSKVELPQGLSLDEAVQSVFQSNLKAFQSGNINLLKAGAVLDLPASPELDTAKKPALGVGQEPDDALKEEAPDSSPTADRDGRLTLSKPESSLNSDYAAPKIREQIDGTQEMIDLLLKENQELRQRIENIESSEYLNTLNELVAIQQKQINELRESYNAGSNANTLAVMPAIAQPQVSAGESKGEPKTLATALAENFVLFVGLVVLGFLALAALVAFVVYQFGPKRASREAYASYEKAAQLADSEIEQGIDSGLKLSAPQPQPSNPEVSEKPKPINPSENVTPIGFAVESRREVPEVKVKSSGSSEKKALDDEVKERIRKKTEEYNSAEISSQAPSRINDVEIDVLVGIDEEVNELLSMAKIYCSAGKYSEARAILSAQNESESDPRLQDALKQISEMERDS